MNRTLIYHGSLLITGGLVGADGLWLLAAGTVAAGPVLKAVGGLSLVVIAIHQLGVADDPAESVPGPRAVQAMALAAVLVAAGYLLQAL